MQDGTQVHKGEDARLASFVGAISIADLVKTTLGPKGMDKILMKTSGHDKGVEVTNDGATILKSVFVDNAAAKVLIDIAKVQDEEVSENDLLLLVSDYHTSICIFSLILYQEHSKDLIF